MSRAKWKGFFLDNSIYKALEKANDKKAIKITSRKSIILPEFVGKLVEIYNGRNFIERRISSEMVNHKFGSISYTRAKYEYKKKKKKK